MSAQRSRRWWSTELPFGAATAATVAVLALVPRLFHPWFYYWDDMMRSFVPQWSHLGSVLFQGRLPLLEPEGWMGGNIIAEAGYGVWSPLNVLTFALAASLDDLPLVGLLVAVFYLALLGVGVYSLARVYGAQKWLSVVVGVAVPFSGFTLFYEATRWPGGLQAFALVTVFWATLRYWARHRSSPLPPMLAGFLAVTTGNPYAAVGLIIVLAGVAVELWLVRRRRRIGSLVAVGAIAGSAGVLVFLPLLLASPVGWRRASAIGNDGFLVPTIGDILALSWPTYQPDVQSWWGPIDASPSTYLAYFIVPLLPWLRFGAIGRRLRQLSSLLVIGGAYLLLSVGMSSFGMFRWPIRLIEYAYLAIAILFAVVASFGFARTHIRARSIATGVICSVGAYLAFSARPGTYKWHILAAVIIVAIVVIVLRLTARGRTRMAAVMMIGGVAVFLAMQGWMFIRDHPTAPKDVPLRASELKRAGEDYQGTTLMMWDPNTARPDVVRSGRLLDGNWMAVAAPQPGVNRYTGLGFTAFADALCMNDRGGVCPQAWEHLWQPYEENREVVLADALGIHTLVVATDLKRVREADVPDGWAIVEQDRDRTVLRRTDDTQTPTGTVSAASTGLRVLTGEVSDDQLTEQITVASDGGRLVLRRLDWPGYEVRIDGVPVEHETATGGLISIRVSPGEHTIDVTYQTPGLVAGLAVLGLGVLGGAAMTVGHVFRSRRRSRPHTGSPVLGR